MVVGMERGSLAELKDEREGTMLVLALVVVMGCCSAGIGMY